MTKKRRTTNECNLFLHFGIESFLQKCVSYKVFLHLKALLPISYTPTHKIIGPASLFQAFQAASEMHNTKKPSNLLERAKAIKAGAREKANTHQKNPAAAKDATANEA